MGFDITNGETQRQGRGMGFDFEKGETKCPHCGGPLAIADDAMLDIAACSIEALRLLTGTRRVAASENTRGAVDSMCEAFQIVGALRALAQNYQMEMRALLEMHKRGDIDGMAELHKREKEKLERRKADGAKPSVKKEG